MFRRSTRKKNIQGIRQTYRFPFRQKKDKDSFKFEILLIVLVVGILLI